MTIRVFASGQSNMVGRGTGGPLWSAVSTRVRVWNNVNPLGDNGTAWTSASVARTGGTFENTNRNNLAVWFCSRLAEIKDEDVDLTMVARGATTISGWASGDPVGMLEECIAVWAATSQAPAHVFLWHQGEGNTSDTHSVYSSAFNTLVADLKSAGVIDSNTVIILGGLSEETQDRVDFNNNVQRVMAANDARITYADSSGLASYDGTHFDGQSLYTLGADRYVSAYLEGTGVTRESLYALVNSGGTPGQPGSGQSGVYNLRELASLGLGRKSTSESGEFTGTTPLDGLLTAAMLAAGSVVEWGVSGDRGTFVRYESGLQLCFHTGIMTFQSSSLLAYNWVFPVPFVNGVTAVVASPNLSTASVNFTAGAKRGGSLLTTNAFNGGASGNIRMESNALYTAGDESCGFAAVAIGFWK